MEQKKNKVEEEKVETLAEEFSIIELEDRLELAADRCNIACSTPS